MDNDYTIFEDGSVKRYYDKSIYDHSIDESTHVKDLTEYTRKRLLEKCTQDIRMKLETLFNKHL